MKKLKLDLDGLKVDSFAPGRDAAGGRGTVQARTGDTNCPWTTDQRDTYEGCSVYYCETYQNTWAGSCQYGTGCQDSIIVCGSHYCPLQPAPSGSYC